MLVVRHWRGRVSHLRPGGNLRGHGDPLRDGRVGVRMRGERHFYELRFDCGVKSFAHHIEESTGSRKKKILHVFLLFATHLPN